MQPDCQVSPSSPSTRSRRGGALDFAEGRLAAEKAEILQQGQAARRVAEHAHDAGDCLELLSMLGLANVPRRTDVTFQDALAVFRSTEGARE